MPLFATRYNPDGQTYGRSLLAFYGQQADVLPQLVAAIAEVAGWPRVRPQLVLGAPLAPEITASLALCLTATATPTGLTTWRSSPPWCWYDPMDTWPSGNRPTSRSCCGCTTPGIWDRRTYFVSLPLPEAR
jgi:hypothetical protein